MLELVLVVLTLAICKVPKPPLILLFPELSPAPKVILPVTTKLVTLTLLLVIIVEPILKLLLHIIFEVFIVSNIPLFAFTLLLVLIS